MLPQAPGPAFLLPHMRTAAALSAGLALAELPVAVASWRDQISIEACRFAAIAALIPDLTDVSLGTSRLSNHGGWRICGSDCRSIYPARESEAEAWLAGYRSGSDDDRGAGVPRASRGFNAVKDPARRIPS